MGRERSATRGKPGRASLQRLKDILLAMPERRLIKGALVSPEGEVCAVGAYVVAARVAKGEARAAVCADLREREIREVADNGEHSDAVTAKIGAEHGLTYTLAWVIGEWNDEAFGSLTPEGRHAAILKKIDETLALPPLGKTKTEAVNG
jgi:hypothetical protein